MNNPAIALIIFGVAAVMAAFAAFEVSMNNAARDSGYAMGIYRCLDKPCTTERLERMITDLNADAKETGSGPNHRMTAMAAGYAKGMADAVTAKNGN